MKTERKRGKIFIVITVVAAFAVLVGFFSNTVAFERMMGRIVEQYVSDNNYELASHISYRLKTGQEFIKDLADSLSRMPEFLMTEDLLSRKEEATELDGICVVSRENGFFPEAEETEELETWLSAHPEAWEEPQISYIKDQLMLFTAPVVKEGQAASLVIGMQSYQGIQRLVSQADYQNQGISVLMDGKTGERIIRKRGSESAITDEEWEELKEILKHRDMPYGIDKQTLSSGRQVFISAYKVEGTDWEQAAIIPSDFLMSQIERYMDIYSVFTFTVMILFMFLICHLLKENQRKEQLFLTDPLTGGWNREGFLKQCEEVIDNRNFKEYAIVYLNVIDFRIINESWGEEDGNRTLQFIFHQFQKDLKQKGELVSRSSMDHFFLLLRETDRNRLNSRMEEAIQEMNEVIGQKFCGTSIDFTIGVCRLQDADSVSSAMTRAISASKQKAEKNVCTFYDNAVAAKQDREQRLNELFEESLKNRDLKIYLQPKVSPVPGEPCQAEALVRWIHPKEGMIYPDEFIPLFEMNGNICQLDLYMFEEVCRLIARWMEEGQEISLLSVNLSRFHLRSKGAGVWKEYKEIKERYNIPDGMIEIELTETVFIDDSQLLFVKSVLDGFRACGFRVALDDFGFAYSSLGVLNELEVDTLKLDRTFFLNENTKSRKIVDQLIQLAHSLNMSVVAEGIEQMEQVEVLKAMRCDLIQGYVYSRPIPVGEFEAWREAYENQKY